MEKLQLDAKGVRWHVLPGRVEPQRRESIRQAALDIPAGAPQQVRKAAADFTDERLRRSLQSVADSMQRRLDEKKS